MCSCKLPSCCRTFQILNCGWADMRRPSAVRAGDGLWDLFSRLTCVFLLWELRKSFIKVSKLWHYKLCENQRSVLVVTVSERSSPLNTFWVLVVLLEISGSQIQTPWDVFPPRKIRFHLNTSVKINKPIPSLSTHTSSSLSFNISLHLLLECCRSGSSEHKQSVFELNLREFLFFSNTSNDWKQPPCGCFPPRSSRVSISLSRLI